MRFVFILISVSLLTGPALAQSPVSRFINRLLNDTSSATSARVSVLPTISYALETGVTVGLRTFSLFYAKRDTANRLSSLMLNTFATTKGQYGVVLENAVYTNRNRYFLVGRVHFQRFPLLYYGIGPDRPNTNPALVNSLSFQVRQRVLRQVRDNFYAGIEFDFQQLSDVKFGYETVSAEPLPTGNGGSRTVGLGAVLVYDSRQNTLNVRRGAFLEASTRRYDGAFGSEYDYRMTVLDGRLYRPLGKPNRILAVQVFGQFMQGTVPFSNLALLGGELGLRGYYLGRYRDQNLLSTQVELRWLPFGFSKRVGGNVFVGTATVAPALSAFRADRLRWAGGFGLQYLLLPRKDVFVRGDVGFSRESTGIYVSIGEAF
jgi:Omp85 superfamily domain